MKRYQRPVPIGIIARDLLEKIRPLQEGEELAAKAGSGPEEQCGDIALEKQPKVH